MAEEVASLYASLELRDSMTPALRGAEGNINRTGDSMERSAGRGMAAYTPLISTLVGVGGAALKMAMDFDQAATNVQAVTNMTDTEIGNLKDDLMDLHTTFSDTQEMGAYYDIVGAGITDQADAMATMNAAIHAAQAGQADLGGATNALIAIMNSYSLRAKDAAHATDVLTGTVAAGRGTYDEFSGAFALTAGTAAQVGVSLEELGFALASITGKGFSAAQSATQVNAIITAMLKPNKDMRAAFDEAGIASGSLALQQYGLAGALNLVYGALDNNNDAFARALGSDEALRGGLALTAEGVAEKFDAFSDGLDGATARAEAIQLDSASGQFALFKQNVNSATEALGNFALPKANEGFLSANLLFQIGDAIFDSADAQEKAQEEATGWGEMLVDVDTKLTYVTKPGDTTASIMAATGASREEAQAALDAGDAWELYVGKNSRVILDAQQAQWVAEGFSEEEIQAKTDEWIKESGDWRIKSGVTIEIDGSVDMPRTAAMWEHALQGVQDQAQSAPAYELTVPAKIMIASVGAFDEIFGAGWSQDEIDATVTGLFQNIDNDGVVNGILNSMGAGWAVSLYTGFVSEAINQFNTLSGLEEHLVEDTRLGLGMGDTEVSNAALAMNQTSDFGGMEQYFSMYSGMKPGDYVGGVNAAPSEESINMWEQINDDVTQLYEKTSAETLNVRLTDPRVATELDRNMAIATRNRQVEVSVSVFLAGQGAMAAAALQNVESEFIVPSPHALGGDYPGGEPILVGEHGPEVLLPGRSGTVVPNDVAFGGGGGGIHLYGNNYFYGVQDMPAMVDQIDEIRRQRG